MDAMLKALAPGLLISSLLISVSTADNGFPRCHCDDEGSFWSIESILETQRVSDFLISMAYFSIPIELFYFVSCLNMLFQMGPLSIHRLHCAIRIEQFALWLDRMSPMLQKIYMEYILLANGDNVNLHMSKKVNKEFALKLFALSHNIRKAIEIHEDLSQTLHKHAYLIMGSFNGIKALQE